jgi:pimeloyl-ACP methyl ester carboxylesterase
MAKKKVSAKATNKMVKGNYASVNGINLYYEIHGKGEPLILLHGGVGASEMFQPIMSTLAKSRQVIAVHLQAHGRTVDIERPLSFELMADDIAALIKHLGLERTDLLGYSLGGEVALQTIIRHPELIHKLVLISVPFKHDGYYPEVLESFVHMGPDAAQFMSQSPLAKLYPNKDWAALFTKLGHLMRQSFDWSKDVAEIKSPVMLIFADADSFRTSHIMEFFALLGGGQRDAGLDGSDRPTARLAILPNATHYDIISSPTLASIVIEFLDAPNNKNI